MFRSVDLFQPLIDAAGLAQDPAWVSWVKHIAYCKVLFRNEFTVPDIIQLDILQQEAKKAFTAVKEFGDYVKPKHHFVTHAPVNILRCVAVYWQV
jgi:hypothetical protein